MISTCTGIQNCTRCRKLVTTYIRVDDSDPIAEVFGLVHEMRHQHDRRTALPDLPDQLPRRPPGLGIEPLRQLVEEDHLG